MEKIGEFSKRCEATVKTLRYYDKLGLLIPDFIDKFTGYRYYGLGKIEEMRRITELKNIGFSLEEIKRFCDGGDEEKKRQMIWEKRRALESAAANTAKALCELAELEQKIDLDASKKKGEKTMGNKFNMPFENDEDAVGRWEIIATPEKKEDFDPAKTNAKNAPFEEIYFLPDGERYWGFGWTKGFLLITFGDGLLCPYEIEKTAGETYMFLEHGGEHGSQTWVLRQSDKKRYTKREIGRSDDIDLPFADDENTLGKWSSVDFVREIEDFDPAKRRWQDDLFLCAVEFSQNGEARQFFNRENENAYGVKWTKGMLLEQSGDGNLAPAYEIRKIGDMDYMFFEWKSGDYIWGRRKPGYYVLSREKNG